MSRNIKDINFDDIDFEDYEEELKELRAEGERLFNDPEIKKLLKKGKKIKKLHKVTDFFEMIINYGFWKTITGKAKKEELTEYFDYLDNEDEEDE